MTCRIVIQWGADEIYEGKFCSAVVYDGIKHIFGSWDMSENQIVNHLRAIESQPPHHISMFDWINNALFEAVLCCLFLSVCRRCHCMHAIDVDLPGGIMSRKTGRKGRRGGSLSGRHYRTKLLNG